MDYLTASKLMDDIDVQLNKCNDIEAMKKSILPIQSFVTKNIAMPPPDVDVSDKELVLWRRVIEACAILALRESNFPDFEAYMSQWVPLYSNVRQIPRSEKSACLWGCMLMHALTSDRLGEFHLLRQILSADIDIINSPIVTFVSDLEQLMADGNYNQIVQQAQAVPDSLMKVFLPRLSDTIRERTVACLECCYDSLHVDYACRKLFLESKDDLARFCEKRNSVSSGADDAMIDTLAKDENTKEWQWKIEGDLLLFVPAVKEVHGGIINGFFANILDYSTEIERIV
eukprot:GHVO01049310.1.p1 GENE.GHVO01049310.1~~GHVO01049310.1.p1  ORF type:complete len:286 (-),score=55.11 GHVO01049310.1:729-1586(-)